MADQPKNRPQVNLRYQRRFPHSEQWPSNNRFADEAVERTYQRVHNLEMEIAGDKLADAVSRFLLEKVAPAEADRQDRQRNARIEGWTQGEPGE